MAELTEEDFANLKELLRIAVDRIEAEAETANIDRLLAIAAEEISEHNATLEREAFARAVADANKPMTMTIEISLETALVWIFWIIPLAGAFGVIVYLIIDGLI